MMLPRLEKETEVIKASSRRLSQGMETSRGAKAKGSGRSLLDEVSAKVALLALLFEVVEVERDLFQKWEEPWPLPDGCDCSNSDPAKFLAKAASVAGALAVALAVAPGAEIVDCALAVGVLEVLRKAPLPVFEFGFELELSPALVGPRHKGWIWIGAANIWENEPNRDDPEREREGAVGADEEEVEQRGDDGIDRQEDWGTGAVAVGDDGMLTGRYSAKAAEIGEIDPLLGRVGVAGVDVAVDLNGDVGEALSEWDALGGVMQ
ncbi:hypothetical protein HG531_006519 [Fusarium graminearum]|nr:hypothetical protein HG531_006519 [Fusarium graminearum]